MRILFVCIHNACRSQMAEAFFNHYAAGASASSAGSKPAKQIDSAAVAVMKEKSIDISGKIPQSVEHFRGQKFDYVITMGCGDACPFVAAPHRIDWQIPDPKGKPISEYRRVRDEIEGKILSLIRELGLAPK